MIGGWRDRPGRFLVWRSSSAVVRPRGRKATRLRGGGWGAGLLFLGFASDLVDDG
jgi:hypothetical protein